MSSTATGSFAVSMTPSDAGLGGAISCFTLSKTFEGDLCGTGTGLMLSAGDPRQGAAGYVAMESISGLLEGREGGFVLQQFGTMSAGAQVLHYEIVPGSGSGRLVGIAGVLRLDEEEAGAHRYRLEYDL